MYILGILYSIHSFSQERVRITHVPSPDTLMPGAYLTLVFKTTKAAVPVTGEIDIPATWQLLSQMQMPGTEGVSWYYSVASKSDNRAGAYPVRFSVLSEGIMQDSATAYIEVAEVSRVEIVAVSPPEYIREGETLEIAFVVGNQGNRVENMVFSATAGELETDSARLAPGESMRVGLRRLVPMTGQSGRRLAQMLSVKVEGKPEPYHHHVTVPVYVSQPKKTDRYLRFPLEAGTSFLQYRIGETVHSGYQYFVQGEGSLDFQKRHTLGFEARGPSQRFFPVLGNYDHYSVSYAYKDRFRVTAGDFQLAFNQLMELGRYGRGGQVEIRGNKVGLRGFYQQPRLFSNQKNSYGGSVSLFFKNGDISASYFSKDVLVRKEWLNSRMVGLSTRIKSQKLLWETEAAGGRALGQYDVGVFNRLNYHGRKISFSNQLIYTGKNFYGFYTNSRLSVSNISYRFHPKAGVGLTHNYTLVNPSLDVTVFSTSPFTNTFTAFFTFTPGTRHRFFIHYSTGDRKDRQEPSTYDYHENTGNFFYTFEGKRMRWNHQARYGYTRNRLVQADGLTAPRQIYASTHLEPSFRLWRALWLGGFAEYQYTSRFSGTDQLQHLFFWGGHLSLAQSRAFRLNLTYRNSYAPDELYESRSYLSASAVWDLKHHRLAFQGGNVFHPNPELRQQNTLFFSLTYTLKLNVPVARKKNTGRVVGKITGVSSGIPPEGLMIRLGGREYLTDPGGNFVFNDLVEDRYLLTLHHLKASGGLIPMVRMPMEVQVRKDSVIHLEIPLSKTGGVQGKVNFEGVDRKPLVLLKLYNEERSFLTDLKEGDIFSFKEVLPGAWKLKVMLYNPAYEADMEEREVWVTTEKTSEVTLAVKPKERKIFFSDQNFKVSLKE